MDAISTTHSMVATGRKRIHATDWKAVSKQAAITTAIALWAFMLLLSVASGGAVAQSGNQSSSSNFCGNAIMTTISNATGFLAVLGPTIGILNAGWNMTKAASSNKSNKKKEAKENIQDSIKYGLGVGLISAIGNLLLNFGPTNMSACNI